MSDTRSKLFVFGAIAVLLVLVVGGALFALAPAPRGPRPIAWDHEACAECKMSIGLPRYAAQIQTTDGRVLDFDDPGCLMTYERQERPSEAAAWFHGPKGWIAAEHVGFVKGGPTPMGYGLVAVDRRSTPGAMTLDEARAAVAHRGARHMHMASHAMARGMP